MSNYTIWGLLGPATWIGWLAVLSFCFLLRAPRSKRALRGARLCAAAAAILFIGFAVLPTGYWLTRPLETRYPILAPADARSFRPDHIVVLAGSEALSASAYRRQLEVNAAAERVIEGAALAQEMPDSLLWILGGVRRAGEAAADVDWTRSTWHRLGIASARTRVVDHTFNTCDNAEGLAAAKPGGRILLVTSAAHMPRAMACFEAFGLKALPYPVDFRLWRTTGLSSLFSPDLSDNIARVDFALHEWVGLAWYRLTGRTRSLLPAAS